MQVSTPGVEAAAQMMVAEADAIAVLARATRPDLLVQVWPWGPWLAGIHQLPRTQALGYRGVAPELPVRACPWDA